jgi:hypothetical protein
MYLPTDESMRAAFTAEDRDAGHATDRVCTGIAYR